MQNNKLPEIWRLSSNIEYLQDPMYPLLPELLGPIQDVQDYWRTPGETFTVRHGDCEDQALLLASLLRTYCDEQYTVWVIGLAGQSGGHVAVAYPVVGGKITILDTAGHFYTNEYGILTANDIHTAVNEWTQWISKSNSNAHLTFAFSHTELSRFSSLDTFADWVTASNHTSVEFIGESGQIAIRYIFAGRYSGERKYEVHISYVNIGMASVAIDSLYMNGIPLSSYTPIPVLGGDFNFIPSLCESGVIKEGIITILDGTTDPSGNRLNAGTTITITLHTVDYKEFYASVVLP